MYRIPFDYVDFVRSSIVHALMLSLFVWYYPEISRPRFDSTEELSSKEQSELLLAVQRCRIIQFMCMPTSIRVRQKREQADRVYRVEEQVEVTQKRKQ